MAGIIQEWLKTMAAAGQVPGAATISPLLLSASNTPQGNIGKNVTWPIADALEAQPVADDAPSKKTPIYQPPPFKRDQAVGFGLPTTQQVTDFFTKPVNLGPRYEQGVQPQSQPAPAAPVTPKNNSIATAFTDQYGSMGAALRPDVVTRTRQGSPALDQFVSATKGMTLDQLTKLMALKPAPAKPASAKDAAGRQLINIATQNYYAVITDPKATDDEKLQARKQYSLDLQVITGGNPLEQIIADTMSQQSE